MPSTGSDPNTGEPHVRQLMVYGGIIVAAAPLAVWLALIVPGFG
ncbi:hypothetical protein ABZ863_00205 [Saccharomonospora sp. NPDC046836]